MGYQEARRPLVVNPLSGGIHFAGVCTCSLAGKDSTDDFEDIGHSNDARKMLKDYYIGDLDPASIPQKPAVEESKKTYTSTRRQDSGTSPLMLLLQILVPLAILALAIAVRFITAPQEIKPAS